MHFIPSRGIAACGLSCVVCKEDCPGCRARGCAGADQCSILRCLANRNLSACHECAGFPCDNPMYAKARQRAFVSYTRQHGEAALLARLEANAADDIIYHREGHTGDYDAPQSEADIIALIENGRQSAPEA